MSPPGDIPYAKDEVAPGRPTRLIVNFGTVMVAVRALTAAGTAQAMANAIAIIANCTHFMVFLNAALPGEMELRQPVAEERSSRFGLNRSRLRQRARSCRGWRRVRPRLRAERGATMPGGGCR